MMRLIDLSANNSHINLRRIKDDGVHGVWHKATEGAHFQDKSFHARRVAANAVGLRFGAYHFARPDLHPGRATQEAHNFCSTVGRLGRRDLRPVLDYERLSSVGDDEWWIRKFAAAVKSDLGVYPIFYANPSDIAELNLGKTVGAGLWLAAYGPNDGKLHPVSPPAPWKKVHAHQYTSRGVQPGVDGPCDLTFAPKLRPLLAHPVTGWL